MVPSKRLEVITSGAADEIVIETLIGIRLFSYTLVNRVQGSGKRGKRVDDDFMDLMHNCLFIIICTEDEAKKAAEALRPIVQEFGGVIAVSDCMLVKTDVS